MRINVCYVLGVALLMSVVSAGMGPAHAQVVSRPIPPTVPVVAGPTQPSLPVALPRPVVVMAPAVPTATLPPCLERQARDRAHRPCVPTKGDVDPAVVTMGGVTALGVVLDRLERTAPPPDRPISQGPRR